MPTPRHSVLVQREKFPRTISPPYPQLRLGIQAMQFEVVLHQLGLGWYSMAGHFQVASKGLRGRRFARMRAGCFPKRRP